jgi:hypothetical protein
MYKAIKQQTEAAHPRTPNLAHPEIFKQIDACSADPGQGSPSVSMARSTTGNWVFDYLNKTHWPTNNPIKTSCTIQAPSWKNPGIIVCSPLCRDLLCTRSLQDMPSFTGLLEQQGTESALVC